MKDDIATCTKVRKCGWKGKDSDLVRVKDKNKFERIESWTLTCPKCGNDEFYYDPLNKEQAK